jgi:tRNA pseudouridine55 synthase
MKRSMLILDKNTPLFLVKEPGFNAPEGMVICIDKPLTWTSADVVRKIKFRLQRCWQEKKVKVGHAGTLDPLATGLLLVCVGPATKQSEFYQSQPKEYIAGIQLGATTSSFDLEKEIDALYPWEHITREMLDRVLEQFRGEQMQMPPVYSAKIISGMRAYELARQGMELPELKQALINIYDMEILDFTPPSFSLRISCSKGTYIRALARDIGIGLESGAHLSSLRRTRSGSFNVNDALTLEKFEEIFN